MNCDFKFIKDRLINLIIKPQNEWKKIKDEETSINNLFLNYAIFVAAIPALAGFIGYTLIGVFYGRISLRYPIDQALVWLIFQYIFIVGGAFLLGLIIDALATSFNSKKDMVASLKVAVYASSVSWALGLLIIIPKLRIVYSLASLYALYILFLGVKEIKAPSKDKEVAYFVVTIIVAIVIFMIIYYLTPLISFGKAYFKPGIV